MLMLVVAFALVFVVDLYFWCLGFSVQSKSNLSVYRAVIRCDCVNEFDISIERTSK